MNDSEIIEGIKGYFDIRELVDKETFKAHGQKAWQFIDIRLLHTVLIIRDELDLPITANDWLWGGRFSQRGLRTNICNIVLNKILEKNKFGAWIIRKFFKLYLSAHCLGKGLDFDVSGMTAEDVRDWILENEYLFPYKIRLEHKKKDDDPKSSTYGKMIPINWVHLDVYYLDKNPKIYMFNV